MTVNTIMLEIMLATMRRYSMLARGERVLVAVSGGPDSVALLHALWQLRDDLGISLHVAHLNHSFRGEESDADAQYAEELSRNLGVGYTVEKVDVPGIQRTLRVSAEEAARMVRYEFLSKVACEVSAGNIALGHTADDQVETVLLNLLRGTGLDVLSGMPPVRDSFIRPIINVRRSQVEEYINRHGLHPRTDATNLEASYTRNKVRLRLLPSLREEYNPEIDSAILRLSELVSADITYLNKVTDEIVEKITISQKSGSVDLDIFQLDQCSLSMRRRVLRNAVKDVRGNLTNIGFIHLEELLRLVDAGSNFEYELPGGTFIERSGKVLSFRSSRPIDTFMDYSREVPVPGQVLMPEIDTLVDAEVSKSPVDYMRPTGSMEIVVDYASIKGKIKVRSWRSGDRIHPLGMSGAKKVQDIFVDAKIPRRARNRIPIIVDDEKVIWVAGLAISDFVRVTASTRDFIILRITPAQGCGALI